MEINREYKIKIMYEGDYSKSNTKEDIINL